MGNHDVGRAAGAAADVFEAAVGRDYSASQALAALDVACERFRGADAEFDDLLYDDTPLRRMVERAFDATAEEIAARDSTDPGRDGELWYAVCRRFRDRYGFC